MSYLDDVIKAAIWDEKPPAKPNWIRWLHKDLGNSHCSKCMKLHECYFCADNHPKYPHHPFCHCVLDNISYDEVLKTATAICPYSKFDPYLFNVGGQYSHNKEKLFESWGYNVSDSYFLKSEVEKQGLKKYIDGDYTLGILNEYGQRLSIRIEIPRKDNKGSVSFITGWIVRPNGEIRLNTPYGGK